MLFGKRIAAAVITGLFLCGSLSADITGETLNGDDLNKLVQEYITNVSNLMPDSTTVQNMWSYTPKGAGFWGGIGLNGSFTMLDKSMASGILEGGTGFGGSNMDISRFPNGLPFLPGGAFDLRMGGSRLDFGVSGMWITTDMWPYLKTILGEDANYSYRTLGVDMRFTIIKDNEFFGFSPAVTLQAGYYFTWMDFGFESGRTEKVDISLRNDSYMGAVQVSKAFILHPELLHLTPFAGVKLIVSKTDSDFSWETGRPVNVRGKEFPEGVLYNAQGNHRDPLLYAHIYGGLGISFLFPHVITVGCSYNVVTEHFGANIGVRLMGTNDTGY